MIISFYSLIDSMVIAYPLVGFAIDVLLKAVVILLLGYLFTNPVLKLSASWNNLIWRMVFAALATLPLFQALIPEFYIVMHSYGEAANPVEPNPFLESSYSTILLIVASGYLAVAAFLVLYLLVGLNKIRHLTHRAQEISNKKIDTVLNQTLAKNGIGKTVTLMMSNDISSPVTWGFRNPVILFPTQYTQWDEALIAQIISHELGHIQRNDWIQQLASWLITCLYWPIPMVWWASKNMLIEAEKACDDISIDDNGCRVDYADNLLQLFEEFRSNLGSLQPALIGTKSILLERIKYILVEDKTRHYINRDGSVPGLLLAIALVVPLAAAKIQLIEHRLDYGARIYNIDFIPNNSTLDQENRVYLMVDPN